MERIIYLVIALAMLGLLIDIDINAYTYFKYQNSKNSIDTIYSIRKLNRDTDTIVMRHHYTKLK